MSTALLHVIRIWVSHAPATWKAQGQSCSLKQVKHNHYITFHSIPFHTIPTIPYHTIHTYIHTHIHTHAHTLYRRFYITILQLAYPQFIPPYIPSMVGRSSRLLVNLIESQHFSHGKSSTMLCFLPHFSPKPLVFHGEQPTFLHTIFRPTQFFRRYNRFRPCPFAWAAYMAFSPGVDK